MMKYLWYSCWLQREDGHQYPADIRNLPILGGWSGPTNDFGHWRGTSEPFKVAAQRHWQNGHRADDLNNYHHHNHIDNRSSLQLTTQRNSAEKSRTAVSPHGAVPTKCSKMSGAQWCLVVPRLGLRPGWQQVVLLTSWTNHVSSSNQPLTNHHSWICERMRVLLKHHLKCPKSKR